MTRIRVTLDVTPEEKTEWKKCADKLNMSLSTFIRYVLNKWCDILRKKTS